MHPTITIAGQQDVLIGNANTANCFILNITGNPILNSQEAKRTQRVNHIDTKAVLMAIKCINSNARGVTGHYHTRDIAVSINGNLQLARLTATDVKTPHGAVCILLSSNGILVCIKSRIVRIFLSFRLEPLKNRHRILLYLTLIIANPYYLPTIGTKYHCTTKTKLFLVNPVRNTINNFIPSSILRHLHFGIVIQQLNKKNIIVTHKSYLITIRGKQRSLLRTIQRQWNNTVIMQIIYIIGSSKRMPIDTMCVCLN